MLSRFALRTCSSSSRYLRGSTCIFTPAKGEVVTVEVGKARRLGSICLWYRVDSPKWAKDSVGFRVALGTWLSVRLASLRLLIDVSSLVSCCLTQHLHTHNPLSLSLLASVWTRVRVTAFASVLARRGSLDSGSLDSLTRRRGRTNLVTLFLVRCETVGKLSLTDFLSHLAVSVF